MIMSVAEISGIGNADLVGWWIWFWFHRQHCKYVIARVTILINWLKRLVVKLQFGIGLYIYLIHFCYIHMYLNVTCHLILHKISQF